jgi:hypothetical protein
VCAEKPSLPSSVDDFSNVNYLTLKFPKTRYAHDAEEISIITMEADMKTLVSSLLLAAAIIAAAVATCGPRAERQVEDSFAVAQRYCPNGRC